MLESAASVSTQQPDFEHLFYEKLKEVIKEAMETPQYPAAHYNRTCIADNSFQSTLEQGMTVDELKRNVNEMLGQWAASCKNPEQDESSKSVHLAVFLIVIAAVIVLAVLMAVYLKIKGLLCFRKPETGITNAEADSEISESDTFNP